MWINLQPGFVAYHVMDTPRYGFIYIGTGKKNWDVPFMILPPPRAIKASVVEGGGDYQFDMGKETAEMPGEGGDFPYESGPDGRYSKWYFDLSRTTLI